MGADRVIRVVAAVALGAGAAAAGCGGDAGDGPAGAPTATRAVVARVNDGDTITLRDGRRVRLVQIDAPEVGTECFGRRARLQAERLLPSGTAVVLRRDPALDERDDYGRLLRYVEVGGRVVNLELVATGAAVPYFFRGDRGRHARSLVAAAVEARRERRGLWGACPGARLDPRIGALTGPA